MPFEVLLGAWVATGLTLFIFTFLYQDNPLFKVAEHLYVGVSVGYTLVKAYDSVIVRLLYEPMVKQGEWSLLVPLLIGLLMLSRYVPKASWLSRYAFAFIVGVGSGMAIPRVVSSYILKQVDDTIRPLASLHNGEVTFTWSLLDPTSNLSAIVVLIGVVSVLIYFFFSIEHKGPVRVAARTGILFLMVSFGAAFGYTVMARMSLLIGRLTDLIEYAQPEYGWASIWLLFLTVGILVATSLKSKPPTGQTDHQKPLV
jgi:lipoprotein signal peptidase